MAQRTVITMIDDMDGSEVSEPVVFGLDGAMFEIDVNEAHAEDLREILAPYVVAPEADHRSPPNRRLTLSTRSAVRHLGRRRPAGSGGAGG